MKTTKWNLKRMPAFIAAMCMLVAIIAMSTENVFAATEIVGSGQMGDNVYWTLDTNGVLTVSGSGSTWDYEHYSNNHDWRFVMLNGRSCPPRMIKIENGITRIGKLALADLDYVTNVEMADSVTEIGEMAFWSCSKMKKIDISNALVVIDYSAFKYCGSLADIMIPDSVVEIGQSAFNRCGSLKSISIPHFVNVVREGTFYGCESLKTIMIPETVNVIQSNAFYKCNALINVYYAGTKDQWAKIRIDERDTNISLLNATIHYGMAEQNDEPSAWAKAEVDAAILAGLVPENLQDNYTEPVSRGEVAQMFVNLIEKSSGKTIDAFMAENGVSVNPNTFVDTKDEAVLAANALGIINGVGGNRFDADGTLTRAQIAAIVNREARVLGISTDDHKHTFTDTAGHWVDAELGWPTSAGIINGIGDNKFGPDTNLTTEQAIAITYRALTVFKG